MEAKASRRQTERARQRHRNQLNKNHYGYIFTAPFIIAFLMFGLYPIIYTFYLSFTDATLMKRTFEVVGFENFVTLFSDKFFLRSIGNTWLIWAFNFVPQIGIALLLSVWFTNVRLRLKLVGIWKSIFYLPNIIMPATIAVLFFSFFDYYGPINQLAVRSGIIDEAFHFFRSELWTRSIVVYIQWWMWFGSTIIILSAGMTSISPTYYESAMVDGATNGQMFRRITVPLLKPVLLYTLVTSLVGGMQMFDIPFLITDGRGSPNASVMTMNVNMYMKFSSSKGHINLAAAVGVVIFIITCVVALTLFYSLRDTDDEGNDRELKREEKKKAKALAKAQKAVAQVPKVRAR